MSLSDGVRGKSTTGDGLLATFEGPSRAVACARAMMDELHVHDIHIRAGVHTGEIEVRSGNQQDMTGVLVTGSNIQLDDRGEHRLKGLDEPWRLYTATAP